MKINLLRAFPDPFRKSMLLYSDTLQESLQKELVEEESVSLVKPNPALLKPSLARYFSQYLCYQVQAACSQGDIHHITDHAYGHLVHTLDARKTVVTFHDAIRFKLVNGERKKSPGFHPVRTVMQYNLSGIKKAAFVICDSESSRRDLIEITGFPREKTEVVPLGVDPSFFRQECASPQKELGLEPAKYLLHIGHVGNYKNIEALFHTLKILNSKGKEDIRLLKAGLEFTQTQTELARDLGVEKKILHLGRLEQVKLKTLYRAADVLLFPSLDEGFGFPVLEAMASSLPVVCSKRGSLPEILGDTGILTEPTDYEAMAQGILKFLDEDAFRKEKTNAALKRAQEFTWQRTAKQTLDIYRRIYQKQRKG